MKGLYLCSLGRYAILNSLHNLKQFQLVSQGHLSAVCSDSVKAGPLSKSAGSVDCGAVVCLAGSVRSYPDLGQTAHSLLFMMSLPHLPTLSNQRAFCTHWENAMCSLNDTCTERPPVFTKLQNSCLAQDPEVITGVAVPTSVISSLHMDLTGMAYAYLHYSKLDQCNHGNKPNLNFKLTLTKF